MQKHWCMRSSAADLITATVCCMESAIICPGKAAVCSERSSGRHYWNQKFGHIIPCSSAWSLLASSRAAYQFQAGLQDGFKMVYNNYKCLHGLAPSYLADVCTPVSSVVGRWQLRSANSGTLVVPGTRTTIGWRNFAVSGPATSNRLPVALLHLIHRERHQGMYCWAESSESFAVEKTKTRESKSEWFNIRCIVCK